MRLGGYDFVVDISPDSRVIGYVEGFLSGVWPDCVVERLGPGELLFYKNDVAKKRWDDLGSGQPQNEQMMIGFLWSDRAITLVTGSRDGPSGKLAQRLIRFLGKPHDQ